MILTFITLVFSVLIILSFFQKEKAYDLIVLTYNGCPMCKILDSVLRDNKDLIDVKIYDLQSVSKDIFEKLINEEFTKETSGIETPFILIKKKGSFDQEYKKIKIIDLVYLLEKLKF